MNPLGEKIKRLREQRNLTQLELADLVGVHQTKISHCETGARGISISLLEELASALHVSFDELFAIWLETERERQVAA